MRNEINNNIFIKIIKPVFKNTIFLIKIWKNFYP